MTQRNDEDGSPITTRQPASPRPAGRFSSTPSPTGAWQRPIASMLAAFFAKLLVTKTAKLHQPFAGYAAYCDDAVRDFFTLCERAFPAAA
jgi:hypothetical protein